MERDAIKQTIIIRSDLEMSRGKIAAQAAHASLMSYFEAEKMDKEVAKEWLDTGEKKIVLKVSDEESLVKLFNAFKFKKVPCALVTDAGLRAASRLEDCPGHRAVVQQGHRPIHNGAEAAVAVQSIILLHWQACILSVQLNLLSRPLISTLADLSSSMELKPNFAISALTPAIMEVINL
jgi:peptidyl-tRNA hydrolase